MKFLITVLACVLYATQTLGYDCHCSPGYVSKMEDGKLQCIGLRNGKIIACIPSPHCKCSEEAIKVHWGKNGEFCAGSSKNRVRIWHCENKEEWKEFRNRLKEKV